MSSTQTSSNRGLPDIFDKDRPKKEIRIAARLRGPGPAAYTLPSTLGNDIIGKKAPAFSFGARSKLKSDIASPGPSVFLPTTTRTGTSRGPAFSLQGRFHGNGNKTASPGPGKYHPRNVVQNTSQAAPAYTFGGRRIDLRADKMPGPAEYAITPKHKQLTLSSSAAYTIIGRQKFKVETLSPGPAAYAALKPSLTKGASPAYSLGGRWDKGAPPVMVPAEGGRLSSNVQGAQQDTNLPGPGFYTPKWLRGKSAPAFSFRSKHSDYELFVPENEDCEFIL